MNLEDTFEVRTIGSRRHSLAQRSVIDKAIDIQQPTNLSGDGLLPENNDINAGGSHFKYSRSFRF